jgi:glycine/D-amino acid oxidase-like deaminating enzyme
MVQRYPETSAELYLSDETAWLDATAELVRAGRLDLIDSASLAEYLTDMAKRDRKEVTSRLVVLLMHLLKWHFQPERRSGSWQATILEQQDELEGEAGSGVLRTHAEEVLPSAYAKAIRRAAAETGVPETTFPAECPYTLDQLLSADLLSGNGA